MCYGRRDVPEVIDGNFYNDLKREEKTVKNKGKG